MLRKKSLTSEENNCQGDPVYEGGRSVFASRCEEKKRGELVDMMTVDLRFINFN